MKIQLKERHISFVVNHLSKQVLEQNFKLVSEIRDKVKDRNIQPEDLIEINISAETLIAVYQQLGNKPEYLVAGINRDMKASLTEQFTAKVTAYMVLLAGRDSLTESEYLALTPEEMTIVNEANEVQMFSQSVAVRDAEGDAEINKMIDSGRSLINS